MTLHCAFIGFGKSTTRYHLPYVLHRQDRWQVAHIYRRRAKPEEQAPQYSHIHFTSDLDEVLNDPDVKLVVVCTHADSHFEYAKRALEAGKNVLVEKPFTPTLAQAKELFALAKSKGLTVTPYQNRRFDSCFLTAKKAIESGKLGEIVEVESHFDYYRPVAETKPGLPQDGAFYGLGVHTMDQIISLFGRPDHVDGEGEPAQIVADRGLHGRVSPAQWQRVCTHLREGLRGSNPVEALQDAIDEVSSLIEGHFPASTRSNDDALPNSPQLLG